MMKEQGIRLKNRHSGRESFPLLVSAYTGLA